MNDFPFDSMDQYMEAHFIASKSVDIGEWASISPILWPLHTHACYIESKVMNFANRVWDRAEKASSDADKMAYYWTT